MACRREPAKIQKQRKTTEKARVAFAPASTAPVQGPRFKVQGPRTSCLEVATPFCASGSEVPTPFCASGWCAATLHFSIQNWAYCAAERRI